MFNTIGSSLLTLAIAGAALATMMGGEVWLLTNLAAALQRAI